MMKAIYQKKSKDSRFWFHSSAVVAVPGGSGWLAKVYGLWPIENMRPHYS